MSGIDLPIKSKPIVSCENCTHFTTCQARQYVDHVMETFESFEYIKFKFDKYQMLAQSCTEFTNEFESLLKRKTDVIQESKQATTVLSSAAQKYHDISISHLRNTEFDQALNFIEKSLEIDPEDFQTWYTKALIYYNLQKYDDTLDSITKANKFGLKEDDNILFFMACCYTELKQFDKTDEILNRVSDGVPKNTAYVFERMYSFYKQGKFIDAEKILKEGLEYTPKDLSLVRYMALVLKLQKKFKDAVKYYKQAIEIKPVALLWEGLAECYLKSDDSESAIRSFESALSLEPENSAVLSNLAFYNYFHFGRGKIAYEYAEKGLAIQPNDFSCLLVVGHYHFDVGQYEKSKHVLSEALTIHNDKKDWFEYVRTLWILALDYVKLESLGLALSTLKKNS